MNVRSVYGINHDQFTAPDGLHTTCLPLQFPAVRPWAMYSLDPSDTAHGLAPP